MHLPGHGAAQVGELINSEKSLAVDCEDWVDVIFSWSWLELHSSFGRADDETEGIAGCRQPIAASLDLWFYCCTDSTVFCKEEVPDSDFVLALRLLRVN